MRHVFADPSRARLELGFAAAEDFTAAIAEFAHAELRTAAAALRDIQRTAPAALPESHAARDPSRTFAW